MVRAGEVDFAVLPARAWPAAGAPAFAALQAPFVLGHLRRRPSRDRRPGRRSAQGDLEHAGVVPLYLAPAQLRRLLTVKPLAGPEDFRGLRIRLYDEATTAASCRRSARGRSRASRPTTCSSACSSGDSTGSRPRRGPCSTTTTGARAHHITAYALFTASTRSSRRPRAWERLSPEPAGRDPAAARDTARFGPAQPWPATPKRSSSCADRRARDRRRAPAQLEALADATEPVRVALRRRPATAPVMRALEATEGAGPQMLAAPDACAPRPARAPRASRTTRRRSRRAPT